MSVGNAHVFPGFLKPVPTKPFFPNPSTSFLTCFSRGERQKYAEKESSTVDRTHNYLVMSPTRSPLNHPAWAEVYLYFNFKGSLVYPTIFTPFIFFISFCNKNVLHTVFVGIPMLGNPTRYVQVLLWPKPFQKGLLQDGKYLIGI